MERTHRVLPPRKAIKDNECLLARRMQSMMATILDLKIRLQETNKAVMDFVKGEKENFERMCMNDPRGVIKQLDRYRNEVAKIMSSKYVHTVIDEWKIEPGIDLFPSTPIGIAQANIYYQCEMLMFQCIDLIKRIKDIKRNVQDKFINPDTPCTICYRYDLILDSCAMCHKCKNTVCLSCKYMLDKCPFCRTLFPFFLDKASIEQNERDEELMVNLDNLFRQVEQLN
jgi:hypothetical protein